MSCGGITPIRPLVEELSPAYKCLGCFKWLDDDNGTPDHFVEEWDGFLHGNCIEDYLKTDEGKCVIMHNHVIQVYDQILQEEGPEVEE